MKAKGIIFHLKQSFIFFNSPEGKKRVSELNEIYEFLLTVFPEVQKKIRFKQLLP